MASTLARRSAIGIAGLTAMPAGAGVQCAHASTPCSMLPSPQMCSEDVQDLLEKYMRYLPPYFATKTAEQYRRQTLGNLGRTVVQLQTKTRAWRGSCAITPSSRISTSSAPAATPLSPSKGMCCLMRVAPTPAASDSVYAFVAAPLGLNNELSQIQRGNRRTLHLTETARANAAVRARRPQDTLSIHMQPGAALGALPPSTVVLGEQVQLHASVEAVRRWAKKRSNAPGKIKEELSGFRGAPY